LARFKLYAHTVDVSPDGRLLVTASSFGSVCIGKMRDGSSKTIWTDRVSTLKMVKFSPNGRYVAVSMTMDKFLRIWNVRSCQLVGKWNGQQIIRSVAFSPDGEDLMSGGWDGTIKSWDVSSLQATDVRISEKDMFVPTQKLEINGHSVSWLCVE
jgi:WD40 repeat protein